MAISPTEQRVLDWLGAREAQMIELLEELVNIDSGTFDVAGVDRVGDVLRAWLEDAGFEVCVSPGRDLGYTFEARLDAFDRRNTPGHVLLMGHRDTVFPEGEAARRPFRVEGTLAYGPGVCDMKAGLVLNAFVMRALRDVGGAPRPVVMLCTADEEIASPEGRAVIEAAAAGARAVFNSEPGRAGGGVVTSRNGALFCGVEITGRAAHSGASHRQGRSAIDALARKVQALHALTDYEKGVTLNVGLVSGGEAVNTVAPSARFEFDCRFPTQAAFAAIEPEIESVLAREDVPDTTTKVVSRKLFLAVEEQAANRGLFEHYAGAADDLGMDTQPTFSGGSADSGYTSAMGVPTLCGTGPVGEHAHTPDEVCHLDTLVPRAQALALGVLRLAD